MDSIIFDVDGTLWDSTAIVARAWNEYLHQETGKDYALTGDRLKGLFGKLLPDIAAVLFPELSSQEQLRLIDGCCQAEHRALQAECAPLYPGLSQTLDTLHKRFPLFIVSNCQAGYIELFLEATGFSHFFKGHLCPGDTGMPKGQNIQKITRDYHLVSPIYVGDTLGDFQACQEAGVPFVFASYGFGEVPSPWKRISSPADLLRICK